MNCAVAKNCWIIVCSLFRFAFLITFVQNFVSVTGIAQGKLIAPSTYIALSQNLQVELQTSEVLMQNHLHLKITFLTETHTKNVAIIDIFTNHGSNSTKITVPCGLFTREGIYKLKIIGNEINSSLDLNDDKLLEHKLDVRWPNVKLSVTPESIETYPERSVSAIVEFYDVECPVDTTQLEQVPTFTLELIYCGTHNIFCDTSTVSKNQVLRTETLLGIQRSTVVEFRCEFFGLAGNYVLHLKPVAPLSNALAASAFLRVDWNSQYIFNVHASSIFPCDVFGGGISVLFQYPACILENDRIRLYAKLRADVISLAPPTSLVYVAEKRVVKAQHTAFFDCELFSEKYIEYCFVYVTQAITNAVADVRMDCVTTLAVSDSDAGKWGKWSEWSTCSSKYSWGTKIRYRFCDSPPPRYGGRFCEGPATESRQCGGPIFSTWDYFFGNRKDLKQAHNGTDVMAEVGPGCRCGCIIHLGASKPKRLLASSSQSCPGRSLWLVQAEEGNQVRLNLDYFILPCATQIIKVRDGSDAMLSELIGEYVGKSDDYSSSVVSSGTELLIDFYLNESQSEDKACNAGFIGHAELVRGANTTFAEKSIMSMNRDSIVIKLNLIHFFVFIFTGIILLISVFLGAQYIFRYHKYQLAKNKDEPESPMNTPINGSTASITPIDNGHLRACVSTSTLISEVITLVKLKPRTSSIKHKKLRESVVSQDLDKEQITDYDSVGNFSNKASSQGSVDTLTNQVIDPVGLLKLEKMKSHSAPESEESRSNYELTPVPRKKLSLDSKDLDEASAASTLEYLKEKSQKMAQEKDMDERSDCSSVGMVKKISPSGTLTSGNYSPALSLTSTARIRINYQKESKEKKNRERLLENPASGSQYSLSNSNQEELEMDYYDYNVINASAAPGSYLGMDPSYLVWIPPIDGGNIINEMDAEDGGGGIYEEIMPLHILDPGSNGESPEDESPRIPLKPPRKLVKTPDDPNIKFPLKLELNPENLGKLEMQETNSKDFMSKLNFLQKSSSSKTVIHRPNKPAVSCEANIKRGSIIEKETSVIKSPSDNKISEFYELSDIKFADDDDGEGSKTYNDTNLQC